MERRTVADAAELPCRDVGEFIVLTQRLAVGRLELLAEVSAARLATLERVEREQFGKLHVIRHPPGVVEARVHVVDLTAHGDVLPELVAQPANVLKGRGEAFLRSRHADVVPADGADRAMELADRAGALDR